MKYDASDYCTNHLTLSKQLAHWQIVPYPSPSDPRETPPHAAMQEFDSLDELLAYVRLVLADVPHDDILADFERGEARPYYTRDGYIVDAMHIITLLDSWAGSRPVHMQEWQTLLGNTLRAQRHFAPEHADTKLLQEMMEMLHHPNGSRMSAILGRHTHYSGDDKKAERVLRLMTLQTMSGFSKIPGLLEYIERMATHAEPIKGHTLSYVGLAKEWLKSGVPAEYVGLVSTPLARCGLDTMVEDLTMLYRSNISADYAAACARQGLTAKAIIMGWENGIHPEYAADL